MSIEPKFKYAKLLNALADMQHTPYYATRKGELREAELAIVELEQQLRDCRRKPLEEVLATTGWDNDSRYLSRIDVQELLDKEIKG